MTAVMQNGIRIDLKWIADMVEPGSRVLDVGCGDGALLGYLTKHKQVVGRGIELSMSGVQSAVSQGLSVIQGDADTVLAGYPSGAFDYAILSQTLQATHQPKAVLENLMRIGRHAIVSIPNFGYWRNRLQVAIGGRMPVNEFMDYQWWDTPNIHFCTLRDFVDLCDLVGVRVERALTLSHRGTVIKAPVKSAWANMIAAQAVFLLTRQ